MRAGSRACVDAAFVVALALSLGSSSTPAQIIGDRPTVGGRSVISVKDGMLTYSAKNRSLRSVLEVIGDQAGVAVVMANGLGKEQVSVEFKNFRLDEAFRQIAKDYDTFFFYGTETGKEAPSLKAVWIYPATQGRRLRPVPPETRTSMQELERMLADKSPEARARAIAMLIERLGHQAESLVMKALRDDSDLVRMRALDQALNWDLDIPRETLADLALHDRSVNVRFLALGALSDDVNSRWVAETALQDRDEYLRNAAREILRQFDAASWSSGFNQSAASAQQRPR